MQKVTHDSEVVARGQQVITACAFIHHNFDGMEKVFLAKRADTKKFLPGVYEIPGGHINFGEDIVAGLKREVMEELEMEVDVGDPFDVLAYVNEVRGSHSVQIMYFARFKGPLEQIQFHPEDHSTCGWFAENELPHAYTSAKGEEDPEFKSIKKGFSLLKGNMLRFG